MAQKKSAKKRPKVAGKRGTATGTSSTVWTAEERAAMRDHAREVKLARSGAVVNEEDSVLAKIAELRQPDRAMAERIHGIIKSSAPELSPRLWYGMPAYAKDGKVVCFFQSAQKFKTRYATFGFSDKAMLDEGNMWPNSFALKALSPAEEARIATLLKKAIG